MAFARPVLADPLPVELTWDAPAECPSHDEVMSELARITRVKRGRVVTPISAQASIERANDGRYRLRLRTQREDQTGDTDLDATTCPVLKRGVTLVLALALGDGVDLVDEKAPPPADEPPAPPAPPKPPPPAPRAKPRIGLVPARPRAGLRWAPWLAATGAWGLNGKPSLGPQLGLEVGPAYFQGLAQVSYYANAAAEPVQGIDSSFSALVGAVGGCGRLPVGAWAFAACAVFEVGGIHGSASGAFRNSSSTAPWYAVGPSFVVTAPLHRALKLRLAASLSVALDPPHFAIQGLRDVYVVSRSVPALSLGLAL